MPYSTIAYTDSTVEFHTDDGNRFHNENGPAYISRGRHGNTVIIYYKHGDIHRVGGPAIVWKLPDGTIVESYMLEGLPDPGHPNETYRFANDRSPLVQNGSDNSSEITPIRPNSIKHRITQYVLAKLGR